jgi:transcriptional antiterminator RfaH
MLNENLCTGITVNLIKRNASALMLPMIAESNHSAHWFCLRSQTKREHIAAAHLSAIAGIEVFCPRIRVYKKTKLGKKPYTEALFPAYLFAKFNAQQHYRQVIHIPGVTGIVGSGHKRVIADDTIRDLQQSLPETILESPDPSLEVGAHVEIIEGGLKGLHATVLAHLPAKRRVEVLLDFLGREIKVLTDYESIFLAAE